MYNKLSESEYEYVTNQYHVLIPENMSAIKILTH